MADAQPIPTRKNFNNLSGKTFGRLLVVGYGGPVRVTHQNIATWICRCECGAERVVQARSLLNGDTLSCGCLRIERFAQIRRKHGLSSTKAYRAWNMMVDRCTNPRCGGYRNYGGRGIRVCERWLSFECFLADMGHRPSDNHSLDRIDNNGDYCPENCRWATVTEQRNNQRNNRLLTHNGRTQTLTQWARELGLTREGVRSRLDRGWTVQRTLDTPPMLKTTA